MTYTKITDGVDGLTAYLIGLVLQKFQFFRFHGKLIYFMVYI